jgi:hypothetical protein
MEACPICSGQAIGCGHFDDPDNDGYDDEPAARQGVNAKASPRNCRLHRFRQVGLT